VVKLSINLIDTADAYGPEVSERAIAEALYPYPRGLVIATKGGYTRPGRHWVPDGHPAHLKNACEASLRRLKIDRIDLYQFHTPDPKWRSRNRSAHYLRCAPPGKSVMLGSQTLA
jgi:pyridoxine 4-dehydrogenase